MVMKIQEKAKMHSFVRTLYKQNHKNTVSCVLAGFVPVLNSLKISFVGYFPSVWHLFCNVTQQTISSMLRKGTGGGVWCTKCHNPVHQKVITNEMFDGAAGKISSANGFKAVKFVQTASRRQSDLVDLKGQFN